MEIPSMKSTGVLVGMVGLLALAVSAVAWGISTLGASDRSPGAVPTDSPEKIAEIRGILFADKNVSEIVAGRHEGRDLWIQMDRVFSHAEAENTGEPPLAWMRMYFEPPVTWEGDVPEKSDPCDPYEGDEGRLTDKNHPCLNEPYELTMRHEEFANATSVHVLIDVARGQVVRVLGGGGQPDEIRGAKKDYATPGTPEQDAQVRDILFRHEAVKKMVAGREEGKSFWVGAIGYVYAWGEPLTSDEKTVAMVDVYFDPPLDWSGPLPTRLDPCEHEGQDERPDAGDPCWSAPLQYEVQPQGFSGIGFYADIDLRAEQVLEIGRLGLSSDDIEAIKARYEQ